MRPLPPIDDRLLPANRRGAIVRFWVGYWLRFFLLVDRPVGLAAALRTARDALADRRGLLRLQVDFLASFLASTALVYAAAAAWIALIACPTQARGGPTTVQLLLVAPVALYAVGYTTANLKALQVRLYLQLRDAGG